jgi:hypothetical protein
MKKTTVKLTIATSSIVLVLLSDSLDQHIENVGCVLCPEGGSVLAARNAIE